MQQAVRLLSRSPEARLLLLRAARQPFELVQQLPSAPLCALLRLLGALQAGLQLADRGGLLVEARLLPFVWWGVYLFVFVCLCVRIIISGTWCLSLSRTRTRACACAGTCEPRRTS
jgi:hypothetical protein